MKINLAAALLLGTSAGRDKPRKPRKPQQPERGPITEEEFAEAMRRPQNNERIDSYKRWKAERKARRAAEATRKDKQ